MSFINQALKGVPRTHQIDLLEKYQTIKKEDILAALQKHFLPLFDPATSVAVVVTAPGSAQSIVEGLTGLGFDVTQKELHIDPTEIESGTEGRQRQWDLDYQTSIVGSCTRL
jgi:Zn-dependent M16 (insulinase) family peptidase